MEASAPAVRLSKTPLRHLLLSLWFGIVLPLAAILLKGWCAEELFDPAPTWMHLALLLLVPVHHLLVLALPIERQVALSLDLLGGVTLGVAAVYSLVFAPFVPIALLAILMFGLGLLPLAPFAALLAGIVAQRRMARAAPVLAPLRWTQRRGVRTSAGMTLGVLLLLAAELPSIVTEYGMHEAMSDDPERAAQGVIFLRRFGDEATLGGVDRSHAGLHLAWVGKSLAREEQKRIYYRVTGKAPIEHDWWQRDADVGGTKIGKHEQQVRLVGSRLDGSIDADAALGYVEWTMVFHNDDKVQAEARGRIALPHGGVVSRARLWIDGEPHEAAFGGAGQVRAAYERVVTQHRDPLLVTEISPDLIQFQCFPIQPDAEMRIALGITFPLDVSHADGARFVPPRLEAMNFDVPSNAPHRAWFEAKSRLRFAEQTSPCKSDGSCVLEFSLPDGAPVVPIVVTRSANEQSWAKFAPSQGEPLFIAQHLETQREPAPGRLAIVIDTSRAMAGTLPAIARALPRAHDLPSVRILLVDERNVRWLDRIDAATGALRDASPQGGVDNLPALLEAATWVRSADHGTVLWLHADQPVLLGDTQPLEQAFERTGLSLIHAQLAAGENALLTQLGSPEGLSALPRYGSLEADLGEQLAHWSGNAPRVRLVRSPVPTGELPVGHITSDHLVRLWARDEIERLRQRHHDEAVALALTHRLVSPVSGAVVLESRVQYEAAFLTPPANLDGVPSVPEPETWAMLILAALLLIVYARKQRRMEWST